MTRRVLVAATAIATLLLTCAAAQGDGLPRLLTAQNGSFAVRPSTIILAGDGGEIIGKLPSGNRDGSLAWKTWNSDEADAVGTYWTGCCGDPERSHRVSVRAARVSNGRFTRVTIRYQEGSRQKAGEYALTKGPRHTFEWGTPAPASVAARVVHPATPTEFAAINRYLGPSARTLDDKLAWVHVSTRGPFALAYFSGGQVIAYVLKGSGSHWSLTADLSGTGLKCGLVPRAVEAELGMERYIVGPRPCETR